MAVYKCQLFQGNFDGTNVFLNYYICDTKAELPSSGLNKGDLAVTLDSPVRQWVASSAVTWVLLPTSPLASGTSVTVGDNVPPVAAGSLGKVDLTGQSASISSVNLTNGASVGKYLVFYEMPITAFDTLFGGVEVQLAVTHTDINGAETVYSAASLFDAVGRNTGFFQITIASGEISYATTVSASPGTGRYALQIRLVHLG